MSGSLAVCAPLVGVLAERVSLRLLMLIGSLMGAAGYALLAVTNSISVYLVVYGLLFGPSICLGSVVVPSALVTRWYTNQRGRALGVVHIPLLVGPLAMAAAFLLRDHGLATVYGLLAGLYLLNTFVVAFAIDPPVTAKPDAAPDERLNAVAANTVVPLTLRRLLMSRGFWLITVAFAAVLSGSVIIGGQLVPMAREWGLETTLAATLFTAMSLAGIIGTPIIGWVIDRFGARTTMVLMCLDCGFLWLVLSLHPPVPVLAAVVVLLGFHGGGMMPVFSSACTETFGPAAFSRTFGIAKMMTLPFTLLAVPAVAAIYVRTGSYVAAQAMQASFMLGAGLLIVLLRAGARRAHPTLA
jgi:MFS family permease